MRLLTVITCIFLLLGCDNKIESSVNLAFITWPGYEPLALAASEGMYENVSINTSRLPSTIDVIRAFKLDAVDVVALTLDQAILLQSKITESLEVITVLDFSKGGDVIISKRDIDSVSELKGKRVGLEMSGLGLFFISRALESVPGVSMSDLRIIPSTFDHHKDLFLNDEVDAVVTFEPVKSEILKKAGHVIFDSSLIPGEIVDVMVAKSSFLSANSEAVSALVAGYFKAQSYITKHPEVAMSKMAALEHIDVESFKTSFAGIDVPDLQDNRVLLTGESPPLMKTYEKLHTFLHKQKFIDTDTENPHLKISAGYLVK